MCKLAKHSTIITGTKNVGGQTLPASFARKFRLTEIITRAYLFACFVHYITPNKDNFFGAAFELGRHG